MGRKLLEKEKMLVTSIFTFSHNVFKKAPFSGLLKVVIVWERVNYLPNDKILDFTKLKAFADNKLNVAKIIICLFDKVENIVGKGENAGYQQFLLFPLCFQKASL